MAKKKQIWDSKATAELASEIIYTWGKGNDWPIFVEEFISTYYTNSNCPDGDALLQALYTAERAGR